MTENNLQSQIAAIESNTGDTIPVSQVQELVGAVKDMFGDHFIGTGDNKMGGAIYHEVGELAKFINGAKKELQDVNSGQLASKEIPDASVQLDEIVRMTENATSTIMDQCDKMQGLNATLRDRLLSSEPPIDPDVMAGVDDAMTEAEASITEIYQACNFQDITGQRIQKVVKALQEIERHVLRMVIVFGLTQNEEKLDDNTKAELKQDAELLSGPAVTGQGLNQDDIDDILATLL